MPIFFGINTGDNAYEVTTSTTTTGKDVEVVINTEANVPGREDLVLNVEKIMDFMMRQTYYPS